MSAKDERIKKAETRKAAQLFKLGWEEGMGVTVWARAATEELARHESGWTTYQPDERQATWERLRYTAALVVISAHQVYVFAERIRKITDDEELRDAIAVFNSRMPPKLMRDLIMHLDEYAVGSGARQKQTTGERGPHIEEKYLDLFLFGSVGMGTVVSVGSDHSVLRDTEKAAVRLAEVAERVRVEQLKLAEDRVRAADHRLHGPF